ncbi:MAG: group I intron-associated PD-(D/E)XK endonuclease [Candidatus Taylorbacteria bacterium]|nr:group I intron-associated PD-(D/E)XK endonuclease [Candidatus Taylorbacteria bacterium]
MDWIKNITNMEGGLYRTINGNANELIAIGRCIKAGFACSKVEVTNGRYDAVIDPGKNKRLLRVQIKGAGNGSVSFTGGGRSGQQISREAASRTYKYTSEDCDLILVVDSNNGDCYIIPISHIKDWGSSKSLSKLEIYKENWKLLEEIVKDIS